MRNLKHKQTLRILPFIAFSISVVISIPVYADTWYDTSCRIVFRTDEEGVHIERCCDAPATLEIPEFIKGQQVVSIEENAFGGCDRLMSVTIPSSVTSIGRYAFSGCRSLLAVTLPDELLCIEEGTFEGCTALLKASIPDNVVYIDNDAFHNCESLLTVAIPASVISIGERAFSGCRNLRILELSEGLESIEREAFVECCNLSPFSLPESVVYVDESAFWGCYWDNGNEWPVPPEGLRLRYEWNDRDGARITGWEGDTYGSLEIPEYIFGHKVTSIDPYAFCGCDKLLSISIPSSVKSIGESAFENCHNLTHVSLPESICRIERRTFMQCESLTTLSMPASVSHIGEDAFCDCHSLIHITLPSALASIGNMGFSHCDSLLTIDVPASVLSIGERAFDCCRNLRVVTLSEGLLSIGDYAFQGCESLASIAIPRSVVYIGENVFFSCNNLSSLSIDEGNPYLTVSNGILFDKDCTSILSIAPSTTHLSVPRTVTSINLSTLKNCRNISYISVEAANPSYASIDGLLYDKGITRLIACPATSTSVAIPDGVVVIDSSAFASCTALSSVLLPSSLRTIGYGAFSGCSALTSLILPTDVTSIGGSAFSGCSGLSSIDLPTNITTISSSTFSRCTGLSSFIVPPKVTRIEGSAFSDCTGLMTINIPVSVTYIGSSAFSGCCGLKSIILPPGLTAISSSTFSGCTGLTTLSIPTNVTQIGDSAISGCTGLAEMTIPATVTRIGNNAFNNCTGLSFVRYLGNAPSCNSYLYSSIYYGTDANLTSYTLPGTTGWTSSTSTNLPSSWQGRKIIAASVESNNEPTSLEPTAQNAIHLTVTNVVIHYIKTSLQPELAIPVTPDTGYVNIITEVKSVGVVAIPETWANNYAEFEEKFGANFTQALTKPTGKKDGAGNDMLVWQDYVAGTDPTDANDRFTASVTIVDGAPIISWTPELSAEQAALRTYTTYGKTSLTDTDWTKVNGDTEKYNFFKVTVEMNPAFNR